MSLMAQLLGWGRWRVGAISLAIDSAVLRAWPASALVESRWDCPGVLPELRELISVGLPPRRAAK